jgi:hypothetical protein
MYFARVDFAIKLRPPTSRSTKSSRHICSRLPNRIARISTGCLASDAASHCDGALFNFAMNVSRLVSASFFPIALGLRLGPMISRFRVTLMVPSGLSSSCQ